MSFRSCVNDLFVFMIFLFCFSTCHAKTAEYVIVACEYGDGGVTKSCTQIGKASFIYQDRGQEDCGKSLKIISEFNAARVSNPDDITLHIISHEIFDDSLINSIWKIYKKGVGLSRSLVIEESCKWSDAFILVGEEGSIPIESVVSKVSFTDKVIINARGGSEEVVKQLWTINKVAHEGSAYHLTHYLGNKVELVSKLPVGLNFEYSSAVGLPLRVLTPVAHLLIKNYKSNGGSGVVRHNELSNKRCVFPLIWSRGESLDNVSTSVKVMKWDEYFWFYMYDSGGQPVKEKERYQCSRYEFIPDSGGIDLIIWAREVAVPLGWEYREKGDKPRSIKYIAITPKQEH